MNVRNLAFSGLATLATLCVSACIVWAPVAMARGGFHGGSRMGLGAGGLVTPVYVLITVVTISDAQAFKAAMADLSTAVTPFSGRLAADADKPAAWDGKAAEHVVIIQFDTAEQAQAWKSSDAFKNFDTELQRSSESTMQLVQGLPTPLARVGGLGRRGRGGFDQKAYEENVKDYDQVLSKMHSICRGC
jgi:uncharacterized protein (DUF1330 family)